MTRLSFDIRISVQGKPLVSVRDFALPPNRMTVLFGESGIGKSLISRGIYGLLDPEEFDVNVNGETYEGYLRLPETKDIRKNGFFVFQEPSTHLNPLLRLGEQLRDGDLSGASDEREILRDIWDGQYPGELLKVYPKPYRPSGGEKQRFFLAMALKKMDMSHQQPDAKSPEESPALFVYDEPTGSLDNHFRNLFLAMLFRRFLQHHPTTLLVTHDYSMVGEITRNYESQLERVSFKELFRENENVALRDFDPQAYLGWVEGERGKRPKARPPAESEPLLKLESGARTFGRDLVISRREGGEPAPLELRRGELTYLKAPSGTGKTTLVKMMMGLLRGERLNLELGGSGGVKLTEETPRRYWQSRIWGRRMTMTFQHADEALNPRSTVSETFKGLPSEKRITPENIRATLRELFDEEITGAFLRRRISTLSGGQKQRINLLRGLFLETDVLILDEPLNGLDFESTKRVVANLRSKQEAGKALLIISHNEEIFDALVSSDSIYYLRRA